MHRGNKGSQVSAMPPSCHRCQQHRCSGVLDPGLRFCSSSLLPFFLELSSSLSVLYRPPVLPPALCRQRLSLAPHWDASLRSSLYLAHIVASSLSPPSTSQGQLNSSGTLSCNTFFFGLSWHRTALVSSWPQLPRSSSIVFPKPTFEWGSTQSSVTVHTCIWTFRMHFFVISSLPHDSLLGYKLVYPILCCTWMTNLIKINMIPLEQWVSTHTNLMKPTFLPPKLYL